MKAYAILWTSPLISSNPDNFFQQRKLEKDVYIFHYYKARVFKMYELSFKSFKKNCQIKDCKIITDNFGAYLFNKYTDIPKNDILIKLNHLDPKYNQIWNFGKLISYRDISKAGEPFLLFDLDLILNEAIPIKILNSDLFAFTYVNKFYLNLWQLDNYKNHLILNKNKSNNSKILNLFKYEKFITKDFEDQTFIPYSCLMGGSKTDIYYKCFSEVIENIVNIDNENYWLFGEKESDYSSRPSISEQLMPALYAYKENGLLFNFLPKKLDILHIGGDKCKLLSGYPYK